MTWNEFKEAVERAGGRDDDVIDYIDVHSVTKVAGVCVRIADSPDRVRCSAPREGRVITIT